MFNISEVKQFTHRITLNSKVYELVCTKRKYYTLLIKVINKSTKESWKLLIQHDNMNSICIVKELGIQEFFETLQKAVKQKLITLEENVNSSALSLNMDLTSLGLKKHIIKLKKEIKNTRLNIHQHASMIKNKSAFKETLAKYK